eukprot:sb/3471766/
MFSYDECQSSGHFSSMGLGCESGPDQNWTSSLQAAEITPLSTLRSCRSKSTHPSPRHTRHAGRTPAGSIFIKQDRNNPCVLLTHSLNLRCASLHCPASVYGHVNLTSDIQSVLAKHHDCLFSAFYIPIKQEPSQHNKYIPAMGGSIPSDKNAKRSESRSPLPTKNPSNSDSVHSHFKI